MAKRAVSLTVSKVRSPVLQAFDRRDLVTRAAAAEDFERKFLSSRASYRFDSLIRGKENKLPAGGRWRDVNLTRLRRGPKSIPTDARSLEGSRAAFILQLSRYYKFLVG
jgi:hypothetical protein